MKRLLSCICARKSLWLFIIVLAIAAALLGAWRSWRFSGRQMVRSTVIVERSSWYEIAVNGRPVLYFSDEKSDSVLGRLSVHRDSSVTLWRSTGFWIDRWWLFPSCKGRVITAFAGAEKKVTTDIQRQLNHEKARLKRLLKGLRLQDAELRYFLRAHGVQDEGYAMVANFEVGIASKLRDTRRLATLIDSIDTAKCTLSLRHKRLFKVFYRNDNVRIQQQMCKEKSISADGKLYLLQTQNKETPAGASPLRWLPWHANDDGKVLVTGFGDLQEPLFTTYSTHATIVPADKTGDACDISPVLAGDGSPVFTAHGWFMGCLLGGNVVDRTILSDLFNNEKQP